MQTFAEALTDINRLRHGKKLVLATGVFDLFHEEHQEFLMRAKSVGDILVVGIESDRRVKELKGPTRPVNNQSERVKDIESTSLADVVFILPDQFATQSDWEHFIELLRPDVYAVSSHTGFIENKQAIMKKYGGEVLIVHQHNPTISTTNSINSMK